MRDVVQDGHVRDLLKDMVQVVGAVGEMIGNHAQVDAFQVACADVFLDLLNQLVIPSALSLMQPLIGKQQNFRFFTFS